MRKLSVIVILVLLMSALMAGTAFAGKEIGTDIAEEPYKGTQATLISQAPGGKWVFDSTEYLGSARKVNTAGDFTNTVPWQIDKIIVYGMNADGNGLNTAGQFTWCIHADAGGVPGAQFWCFATPLVPPPGPQPLGVTHNSARINLDLQAGGYPRPMLPPGTWWLLAWPSYPGTETPPGAPPATYNAQWYWKGSGVLPGANGAALLDPTGLWEATPLGWIPWSTTTTFPNPPSRDMAFVLEGSVLGTPTQVWVDLNASALWCAAQGHLFGFDCFTNVQAGIGALTSGGTVYVGPGTYNEAGQIVIGQNITVIGQGCGATTIMPLQNTGSGNVDAGGWWLVNAGKVLNLSNMTLDGTGWKIWQALRYNGSGNVTNVCFNQIQYDPSTAYQGTAIRAKGDAPVNVTGCTFTQIGRIGLHYGSTGVSGSVASYNIYSGKGAGTWLDYGIEVGWGASVTLQANQISGCTGQATDGSTSAAMLVTDYFAPGTAATITGNTLTGNTTGVAVGYGPADASTVVANNNCIYGNSWGVTSTGVAVDATGNWWGSISGPAHASNTFNVGLQGDPVTDNVAFVQWLNGCGGALVAGPVWTDTPDVQYFSSIQAGVNYATGGTVHAVAGTFTEQVEIAKAVAVQGAGKASTSILSPNTLAKFFVTGTNNNYPIVYVHDIDGADIQDLTVDGLSMGNANYRFVGIAYQNAGGTVSNVKVWNIQNNPFDGAQHGNGIYGYVDDGGPHTVNVEDCDITEFQKNGMTFIGEGLTVNADSCVVTGKGPTGVTAQNGIQIADGAAGTVTDCTVTGIGYTGSGWVSSGLLFYEAGNVAVSGGSVTNSQMAVVYQDTSGSVQGLTIVAADIASAGGISVRDYGGTLSLPEGGMTAVPVSPMDARAQGKARVEGSGVTLTIDDVDMTGTKDPVKYNRYAIDVWAYPDSPSVTVTNSDVHDWSYGFVAYAGGGTVTLTANQNCIWNNDAGYWTNSANTQDAEDNYWGSPNGPAHSANTYNVGNQGDWSDGNIDFVPWLTSCRSGSFAPVTTDTPAGAYASIEAGVNNATGGTVTAAAGTFTEDGQIVVENKTVTVAGAGCGATIVKTNADTGSSGDARAWWLVKSTGALHLAEMTLDGTGYKVSQGVRILGGGSVDGVCFTQIQYEAGGPSYAGMAVAAMGTSAVNITDSFFDNIGRIGVIYYGSGVNGSVYDNNEYTGKGDGDWLDYGVEVGGGAQATVSDSTITDCTGVADVDGSTSGAIMATTYFGAGTAATITGNTLSDNTTAIIVGYDASDTSTVVAHDNCISGNDYGAESSGPVVDATDNWWGSANGPAHASNTFNVGSQGDPVSNNITFVPWLDDCGGDSFAPVTTDTPAGKFASIQAGVDYATGGNVTAAAGTFTEQVIVDNKALTLKGSGTCAAPTSTIKAFASMPSCFTTGTNTNVPIVCIRNSATVTVDNFKIDGAQMGNTNYRFIGVAYRNAGGTVSCNTVVDIADNPFSGAQHGVAIYAYNDDAVGRTINVWDNIITGFQKNAMALNAGATNALAVDVQRNVVTGAGPTAVTAQNGIQVNAPAGSGTVSYNTISGIAYSGSGWTASSILTYTNLDITHNVITGGHMGVYHNDNSARINYNTITPIKAAGFAYGVCIVDPPGVIPSPFGAEGQGGAVDTGASPQAAQVVQINNNTITYSGDKAGTYGIDVNAGYTADTLTVTANDNTVTGFFGGIGFWKAADGAFTAMTAQNNDLSNNGIPGTSTTNGWGMCSDVVSPVVLGTNNWWGHVSGPYHSTNPSGQGSAVCDYITFSPWQGGGLGTPMLVASMNIGVNSPPARKVWSYVWIRDWPNYSYVVGATIYVTWTLPDSSTVNQQGLTGTYGSFYFSLPGPNPLGTYQICVTNVTKTGWSYDPLKNWVSPPCQTITLTTGGPITVDRESR